MVLKVVEPVVVSVGEAKLKDRMNSQRRVDLEDKRQN